MRVRLETPVAVAFLVGLAALLGQFIVNRIVFFYIANSEYTAASIIALHLGGFWLGASLIRRYKVGMVPLALAMLGLTVAAEVLVWRLGAMVMGLPLTVSLAAVFGLALAALSGAFVVGLMPSGRTKDAAQGQRVLVADTAGSVAGALLGGFWLLPVLGIHGSFVVLLVIQLVLLAVIGVALKMTRWGWGAGMALLAGIAALALTPALSEGARGVFAVEGMPVESKAGADDRLLFSERSAYGLVSVVKNANRMQLGIDGRPLCATGNIWKNDKGVDMSAWVTGGYPAKVAARHERARMANIGLGCGMTMAAMLQEAHATATVDVIEINPVVLKAQREFDGALPFTQDDPRLKMHRMDGFRYFAEYDGPAYDAVAIDVAWMQNMNATHLFSVEMYRNIRRNMKPEGVLGVWIEETNPLSPAGVVIYRTLKEVFADVVVDDAHGAVVFYASAARPTMMNDVDERSADLSGMMAEMVPVIPLNRLDNLVMNRVKFKWWGDSTWERLLQKYDLIHDGYWNGAPE